MVVTSGCGDLDGIDIRKHLVQRSHPGRAEFGGDLRTSAGIRIHHRHQGGIWCRSRDAGVMLPEVAYSDNSNTQLVHGSPFECVRYLGPVTRLAAREQAPRLGRLPAPRWAGARSGSPDAARGGLLRQQQDPACSWFLQTMSAYQGCYPKFCPLKGRHESQH